jgi:hypothetical protein
VVEDSLTVSLQEIEVVSNATTFKLSEGEVWLERKENVSSCNDVVIWGACINGDK